MENAALVLGVLLLITGTSLWVVTIFRALGNIWTLGLAELWLLPAVGFGLILLGMWLI